MGCGSRSHGPSQGGSCFTNRKKKKKEEERLNELDEKRERGEGRGKLGSLQVYPTSKAKKKKQHAFSSEKKEKAPVLLRRRKREKGTKKACAGAFLQREKKKAICNPTPNEGFCSAQSGEKREKGRREQTSTRASPWDHRWKRDSLSMPSCKREYETRLVKGGGRKRDGSGDSISPSSIVSGKKSRRRFYFRKEER